MVVTAIRVMWNIDLPLRSQPVFLERETGRTTVALGGDMRSELVFCAKKHIGNRYLLVRAAAQAVRKVHRPHARIADTTNEVLEWFARGNPFATRVTSVRTSTVPVQRAA